jgi:tetratricopeptide (TPR) repeat protein
LEPRCDSARRWSSASSDDGGKMKLGSYIALAFFSINSITGCAGAINAKNASRHANAANAASKAGDWATARKQWAQALVDAQLAGASPRQLAVFNYEYGRALGVQCFWEESENYLQKAYELDSQSDGPEFMSLVELSRLQYDQRKFEKSLTYYSRAIASLEKVHAPTQAPAEFSVVLEEYAKALRETGKEQEAISVQTRANEIRAKYTEGKSITDRTPYGKYCSATEK